MPIYNKELANDSNLSINVKSDNEIVFFKDLRTNLEFNGYDYDLLINNESVTNIGSLKETRAGYQNLATLELFDDINYGDSFRTFYLTENQIEVTERRMHYISFNDKCSSLKVRNNLPNDSLQTIVLNGYSYPCALVDAVFLGYEDKDYRKGSITYIATPGTVRLAPSLPGFNDKMSSFRFLFAQRGQYSE